MMSANSANTSAGKKQNMASALCSLARFLPGLLGVASPEDEDNTMMSWLVQPVVPIPNTVVKPTSAHGTARATAWDSRSSPAQYSNPAVPQSGCGVARFGFGTCGIGGEAEIKGDCPCLPVFTGDGWIFD